MKKGNWKMTDLRVEFNTYGEFKGQYTGRICFESGEECSFTFFLRPEMTAPYIHLIANEVAASANELGQRLIQSFAAPEVTGRGGEAKC